MRELEERRLLSEEEASRKSVELDQSDVSLQISKPFGPIRQQYTKRWQVRPMRREYKEEVVLSQSDLRLQIGGYLRPIRFDHTSMRAVFTSQEASLIFLIVIKFRINLRRWMR